MKSAIGGGPTARASTLTAPALRPWHRLAVRLATVLGLLTVLTIGVVAVLVHERQRVEVEDTVGTQLLNVARTGVLLVDPAAHAEIQRTLRADSPAYRGIHGALAAIRREAVLTAPIRTLANYDARAGRARVIVSSEHAHIPGAIAAVSQQVAERLAWSFEDGVARYTGVYSTAGGAWISAFAPVVDVQGRAIAVLALDYPVDLYFDRLRELRDAIIRGSLAAAAGALLAGLLLARRLTRPISALTAAVTRVAGGDLSQALTVRSRDEVGQLTRAFNEMVDGLRQRDFIRNAFGRYVSPEVARTLLESPDGLRLGGHKREITVLMSDLRGYTRFAEHGEPAAVMDVLNEYLGRMADIVIAHGGTVNEFIGDAVFAVFGAPVAHPDHAERAAAAALAMQAAMQAINEANVRHGRPRFEMGIGINTGEAVVGNIGSEQRAKYAVVGAAVNLAARIEGCTVGGQILVSAATRARLGAAVAVAAPVEAELKGLDRPVLLYELGAGVDPGESWRETSLPLVGSIVDGKRVQAGTFSGAVRRLGDRKLEAALDARLPALTNVRLRLTFPDSGLASGDVYGKVTATADAGGRHLTRIHLTSIDPGDRARLDELARPPHGSAGAAAVSQTVEEP